VRAAPEMTAPTAETAITADAPPTADPPALEVAPGRRPRRVLVPVIAGVAAVVLGVSGWLVADTVALAEARAAYESSLAELDGAREASAAATAALAVAIDALGERLPIAEALVAQLGASGDILVTANLATEAARAAVDADRPTPPVASAGRLPESPAAADYAGLEAATRELTGIHERFAAALAAWTAGIGTRDAELTAAWAAHAATAPASADSLVTAHPNAGQELQDEVVAAAAAIAALEDPLAEEAPALWAALVDAQARLAAAEQAYQEQLAAQQASRSGSRSRGGSGGAPGSGGSSGGAVTLADIEAALAQQLGIPVSDVRCFDIPNGVRCEYPGGWREVTI